MFLSLFVEHIHIFSHQSEPPKHLSIYCSLGIVCEKKRKGFLSRANKRMIRETVAHPIQLRFRSMNLRLLFIIIIFELNGCRCACQCTLHHIISNLLSVLYIIFQQQKKNNNKINYFFL